MTRVIFGLLWAVGIYFVTCMVLGGIAGGMAGAENPENAAQAGAEAGARIVGNNREWIMLGSAFVAGLGTLLGWLPGTKPDEDEEFVDGQ